MTFNNKITYVEIKSDFVREKELKPLKKFYINFFYFTRLPALWLHEFCHTLVAYLILSKVREVHKVRIYNDLPFAYTYILFFSYRYTFSALLASLISVAPYLSWILVGYLEYIFFQNELYVLMCFLGLYFIFHFHTFNVSKMDVNAVKGYFTLLKDALVSDEK